MANNRKKENTIAVRQAALQERLLEQFRKMPIVQVACQAVGISRATYYRWRDESPEFATCADRALSDGEALINDMSESQLTSLIREKNLPAITFWLRHHHPSYTNRLEITAKPQAQDELTPEQEAAVREALRLASLVTQENVNQLNQPHKHEHRHKHDNPG